MKSITLITILLLFIVPFTHAQKTHKKKGNYSDHLSEKYHVLKSNKDIKDGLYELSYKGQTILLGQFDQSVASGKWQYFNSMGDLEFEYDFSIDSLISWNNTTKLDAIRWERGTMKNGPFKTESYHVIPHLEIADQSFQLITNSDTIETDIDIPPLCLNSNLVFQFTLFDILRNSIESFPSINLSLISFTIDEDGDTKDFRIEATTGRNFESQFIEKLQQKKFHWSPAIKNGQPVKVRLQIPIIIKTFYDDPEWTKSKIIFSNVEFMDAKKTGKYKLLPSWDYKLFETPYNN